MLQMYSLARHLLASVAVFCILTPVSATAAELENLYTAEVLVPGQGVEERNAGMASALKLVVSKASGVIQLPENAKLNTALSKAGQFARTFGYAASEQTLTNAAGEQIPASLLRVTFDKSSVVKILRDASLPVWGENRPSLLVWLIEEKRGQRTVTANEATSEVQGALIERAEQRGVPILLPIMDLEDQVALSETELWGLFVDPIEQASLRYNPDAVLAGRFYRSSANSLEGRWVLIIKGQRYSLDVTASSEAEIAQQGIDLATIELGKRYAVQLDQVSDLPVKLYIDGITNAREYAEAMAYLQELTAVRSAKPIEVSGSQMILHLTIDGSLQKLRESVELNALMTPQEELNALEPVGSRSHFYQWQGRR